MVSTVVEIDWEQATRQAMKATLAELRVEYPNLQLYLESGRAFLRGSFPLIYEGKALDRFLIEVEMPSDSQDLPIVREIGGRIPRILDNHIEGPAGNICTMVPEERYRVFPRGAPLLQFLNGPVRNYFLGITMREIGLPWPFGERPHGRAGVIEFYTELVGSSDEEVIRQYMLCIRSRQLRGHRPCPCGSGKKIRNCHIALITELRLLIHRSDAARSHEMYFRPKLRHAK